MGELEDDAFHWLADSSAWLCILFVINQNGSLLRKYTYLSNDSSYSASPEDGVDIKFLDNYLSDDNNDQDDVKESSDMPISSSCAENESKKSQSFTFEAQV